MSKSNKIILVSGIVLLAALLAAYSNHFNNGFHFDDSHTVVDNVYIRNLNNIPGMFTDPRMFSSNPLHWSLRPLVTITLAIDYWLGGGLKPFYFQLSTFVWFSLTCLLLFFVYKRILSSVIKHHWAAYLALFAVAWYALHTANAETVNYIISRSDVLSTFFIVLSLLIYIALPQYRKFYLYAIPALIGCFAKETVLTLVVFIFFYALLFEQNMSLPDIFKVANFKKILVTIAKQLPLLLILVVTELYLLSKATTSNAVSNPTGYYILTQSYVWLHYVIEFFLPMNLSADSDWGVIKNLFDERIIIGLIFVTGLVVAVFKTSVKPETRPITFGLIWFAASLLPTSLVPLAEVTNDHRMFFAFIGLSLSVVTYIGLWLIKNEQVIAQFVPYRVLIAFCGLAILSLNAYGVYKRNIVWNNEESLWYDVTIKSPANGRGLMNYGLSQMQKGNYVVAADYFNRALVTSPYYNTLYINLGVLNGAMNKDADAEADFKKAMMLSPTTDDSYIFYARFLTERGRFQDAQVVAEKAYQINHSSLMTLNLLMNIYNKLMQWDKLAEIASRALTLLPNDANVLAYANAAKNHQPLVALGATQVKQPATLTAADYLNLSLNYYNAKDYQKCIEACKKALALKPNYADAYSNMGAAYNMMQEWKDGEQACLKALQIDPNHRLAKGNLAWAKSNLDKH